jgi:hypothetical protein
MQSDEDICRSPEMTISSLAASSKYNTISIALIIIEMRRFDISTIITLAAGTGF